jgi:hypothetical protein
MWDSKRAASHSEVKKCPVDTFLARGRILRLFRRRILPGKTIAKGRGCTLPYIII